MTTTRQAQVFALQALQSAQASGAEPARRHIGIAETYRRRSLPTSCVRHSVSLGCLARK